jgi:beta-barrel assembly-enhancing protease
MTSRILRLSALLTAALLVAGCSSDGSGSGLPKVNLGSLVGGQRGEQINALQTGLESTQINEDDDDELGRTVVIAATNMWPLYEKPELTKYVTLVGLTVADVSSQAGGNWVFGVLDTPDVGAYSGPNGYVLITRGAINLMQDEAELAAVIAHEVAHVVARDGSNAVKNAKFNEALIKGAMTAAPQQRGGELLKQFAGPLIEKTLKSGWSQGQETAADQAAVKLLIAAGYDANAFPRFLQRVQERQGRGSNKLFSTHPGTADRIARTTAQINAAKPKPGATNRERFAKSTAEAKL